MKVSITFKTPDALYYVEKNLKESFQDDPEKLEEELDGVHRCVGEYIQYGEQITVEFDTETGTATVLPVPHRRGSY
jgi:hypothetical protein